MQKVLIVFYKNSDDQGSEANTQQDYLNSLLNEGWKVTTMCSFSEPVAIAKGSGYCESRVFGKYGMTFVLEKEDEVNDGDDYRYEELDDRDCDDDWLGISDYEFEGDDEITDLEENE